MRYSEKCLASGKRDARMQRVRQGERERLVTARQQ